MNFSIEHLKFAYKKETPLILDDISFFLPEGKITVIMGANGAGKSTLLKCLNHIYKPVAGCVLADGKDVGRMTPKERASFIGYVPQNTELCPGLTVWETILSGKGSGFKGKPSSKDLTEVEKILKDLALERYAFTDVCSLSGGERQRVLIGRALAQDPKIILLDEPTAGQDFRHYTDIMEFLQGLNTRGVTVVMITHDMHLILEYTPRALVFCDGQLIADRSASAVLCDPELIGRAALKETSLYTLANRCGIAPAEDFVERFIAADREVRAHGC